jgi:hypothetical protein
LRQVFENLQAGCTFLAVDKYFRAHLNLTGLRGVRGRRNAPERHFKTGWRRACANIVEKRRCALEMTLR